MNVSNTFYDFIISFNGHPLQLKLVLPKLSTWIESYWHLMFSSIKTPTSMKYNLGNLWKWQCLRKREKNVLVQIPPMDSFLVFQPNLLEICPPPLVKSFRQPAVKGRFRALWLVGTLQECGTINRNVVCNSGGTFVAFDTTAVHSSL